MYAMNEKVSYDPGRLTPGAGHRPQDGPGRARQRAAPADISVAAPATPTVRSTSHSHTAKARLHRTTTRASPTTLDTWNLGASYDFGVVKLFGEYSNAKLKRDSSTAFIAGVTNPFGFRNPGADGWLLGATIPVGPGLIRLAYSAVNYKNTGTLINPANPFLGFNDDAKADKFAVGYVHNLSKRTALYATVARVNNKNGADLTLGGPAFVTTSSGAKMTPKSSTGYDLGIRHSF